MFLELLKKYAALPAIVLCSTVCAEPLGIFGGQDTSGTQPAYAALISSSGIVTPITLDLSNGVIESVAINAFGQGIIGGQNLSGSTPAYAALISPLGVATPITLSLSTGDINSISINDSSQAIIGGRGLGGSAYAALISPAGIAAPISLGLPLGEINSVSINESNQAIIGGQNLSTTAAYAALISPAGIASPLTLGIANGIINTVAINDSSQSIIGGVNITSSDAYAALISPAGVVAPITLSISDGIIYSAAINNSNQAIIGGIDNTGTTPAYAALISPSGTETPIALGVSSGRIKSVSLNSSNYAIVGGENLSGMGYAALISPEGTATPIALGTTSVINSVAINEFNQSLVGGENTGIPYLAIISPTGIATPIMAGFTNGFINSVAILSRIPTGTLSGNNLKFANYINQNAPQNAFYFVPAFFDGTLAEALESAAPTRNAISLYTASNNLFYLNHSLSNHLRNDSHFRSRASSNKASQVALGPTDLNAEELTASLNDEIAWQGYFKKEKTAQKKRPYTLWFDGIGALSYQKAQKQTVGFNPSTGAAILGFDAAVNQKSRVGGGAAYTYTHIHEKKDAGHSHINQEYLFVYGTYQDCRFYLDAALWGGLFQIDQVRKIHMTGFEFKSTSHPHGWQLAPHLELGYNAINSNKLIVDPFVMADWVSAWQDSYKEKGSGHFNAGQKEHYSSFLRTEAGVRVYETISFDSWRLTFQEKGSYVYKKPFRVGRVNTFLVGSPGSFTVATLTTPQNLGVGEFAMIFEPASQRYPYGSITYQGEFGSSSQAHQVSLELAWNF